MSAECEFCGFRGGIKWGATCSLCDYPPAHLELPDAEGLFEPLMWVPGHYFEIRGHDNIFYNLASVMHTATKMTKEGRFDRNALWKIDVFLKRRSDRKTIDIASAQSAPLVFLFHSRLYGVEWFPIERFFVRSQE